MVYGHGSWLEREGEEKWIRFRDPFHVSLFLFSISVPYHLFIFVLT